MLNRRSGVGYGCPTPPKNGGYGQTRRNKGGEKRGTPGKVQDPGLSLISGEPGGTVAPTTLWGNLHLGSQVRTQHKPAGVLPKSGVSGTDRKNTHNPGESPIPGKPGREKGPPQPQGVPIFGKPGKKRDPPQPWGDPIYLGSQAQREVTHNAQGGPQYLRSQAEKRVPHNPWRSLYLGYEEGPNRTPGGCSLNLGCQAQITHNPGGGPQYLESQIQRGVPHNPGGVLYIWGSRQGEGPPQSWGMGVPKKRVCGVPKKRIGGDPTVSEGPERARRFPSLTGGTWGPPARGVRAERRERRSPDRGWGGLGAGTGRGGRRRPGGSGVTGRRRAGRAPAGRDRPLRCAPAPPPRAAPSRSSATPPSPAAAAAPWPPPPAPARARPGPSAPVGSQLRCGPGPARPLPPPPPPPSQGW